ncbi:MAG: S8 family serine peptidase [Gaiellaceae bacterium]
MLRVSIAALAVLTALVGPAGAARPTDPLAATLDYESVDLPAAWDLETGSPDVVIAVVDSGVDAAHPDLAGALVPGHNFLNESDDTTDPVGHGTAVAGILAARANNGIGAAGVCWNCRIMALRVLRPEGFALKTTMARAIDYAVDHGAAVINVSLYGEDRNGFLHDSIHRAREAGVLVATAAGNEGWSLLEYPAAYPDVISVGATDEDGALAFYSNRGPWVKLAAPGCVLTTQVGGGFGAGCGTSGATPIVAGIVALLRAHAPFASSEQIEAALERTARPVAGVRFGRVDAFAALQLLGQPGLHLRPVVEGYAGIGRTLRVYTGVWAGAPATLEYTWIRGARTVVGHQLAYTVRRADLGARLRCIVTARAATDVVTATSPRTERVRVH